MPLKRPLFIFLFLTIASFIARLMLISVGPYHTDCLNIALKAQETFETGHLAFALGFGCPVVVTLGAVVIAVFNVIGINDPVLAVNFLSVVFGSLAVGALYLFTARWLEDEAAAIFAAVLFSMSPIFLATSVYGMNHIPAVFFLLFGLYLLAGYFKNSRLKSLIAAGVVLGLMGGSRIQDMVLMLPAISVLFLVETDGSWSSRVSRLLTYWATVAATVIVLHLPYLADRAAYAGQIQDYWSQGLVSNFRGLFSPYLKVGFKDLCLNFLPGGLIIAAAGWFLLWRYRPKAALVLGVWILISFFFLSNLLMNRPRFFIVVIPAMVICQAAALTVGSFRRWMAAGIAVILIAIELTAVWPGIVYRHRHATIVDFAEWVGRITPPNARIITGDEGAFIHYYGQRTLLAKPLCNFGCSPESLQAFGTVLDRALAQGPVYMTDIALLADNPKGEFQKFMESRYSPRMIGEHLYEDWHSDCFARIFWKSRFYRLRSPAEISKSTLSN